LSRAACSTFIGATTENPSFEVNSALLSRASVYVLKSLDEAEMGPCSTGRCERALADLDFDDDARSRLIGLADGDARRLLNLLEQVRTAAHAAGKSAVDGAFIEATMAQNLRRFDKGGDAFYDQISALHKSVRGSNPDGALYWLLPHARRRRSALPRPASSAWPGRTSAWPIRVPCRSPTTRPIPTNASARRRANWRSGRR
jgi:replication-associated recombination protein RarA